MPTTAPALIANLAAYHSRRDVYGNCYWLFSYTDHATGRTVSGAISGGESNIRQIPFYLNGGSHEPRNVAFSVHELPIRQFNRMAKPLPYAGCLPEELAAWIKKELAP